MEKTLEEINKKLDTKVLLTRSLQEWRDILIDECQVYNCGENYLARRLNFINFTFCNGELAEEILVDNLYLLLRNYYFKIIDDEVDKKINEIITSFTRNLKSTLKTVSFDETDHLTHVSYLPDYCLAFRNGVYNFKDNRFLFTYNIIKNDKTGTSIYLYDNKYIINWYFNIDFEDIGLNILDITSKEIVDMFKELAKDENYDSRCFKLLYNMSHDESHKFSLTKFEHLCEILGYTSLGSFSQHFVMMIGSGSNGKNSLFDGCFKKRVIPSPESVGLDTIEKDRFITGRLENKSHNIFLETSAKVYTDSNVIKALSGSMYQSIEKKGQNAYASIINCKYIFAGNDQDNIKFSDTTTGFRRRINVFEIFYQWDSKEKYLTKGDYYQSNFSDDLKEFNVNDVIEWSYFAMLGIKLATHNFTNSFKFTYNNWKLHYSDVDVDLKDRLSSINTKDIVRYLVKNPEAPMTFYTEKKEKLTSSKLGAIYEIVDVDSLISYLKSEPYSNEEESDYGYYSMFYDGNKVYISTKSILTMIDSLDNMNTFTRKLKRLYPSAKFERIYNNNLYILVELDINGKIKIFEEK